MVKTINKKRANRASKHMLKIKSKTSGKWSGVEEIRKWRDKRRSEKIPVSMFGADREHLIKYTQKEHEEFVADEH
ncbi:MAG: hypothetical protein HMLIMOIP_000463 [Candidatus Nitrosomirales archaeon]|jgi:hypothetical protein